ncbi:DUF421 domain-containing protein [Alteribacillus sp. HJP-4]|uniref:DUF421 domain-containing protein n=1 Tax=Alteribacillus sp. HJP-4 TaxID=2775394 RepID=UPI0035CD1267
MDFLSNQDSLNIFEWALRAAVGFLFLVTIAKVMGQRSISQLRFLDFVMALVIGNIMAHPLSDESLGLTGAFVTISVLTSMYLGGVLLSLKWRMLTILFEPSPLTLIDNGMIQYRHLKKARITLDSLLAELRKEKVDDIKKVAKAFWEPGGTISIFLDPKYQPLTPADMGLTVQPFDMPRVIIREGKINQRELELLGRDLAWLYDQANIKNVPLQDILLATIDHNENIHICLYQ